LLDQLGILGCRLVDVASSGKNKQLIGHLTECVWSGIEVLADPSTTLALAEVTANLCHALEMEDALRETNEQHSHSSPQKRWHRNQQQQEAYVTRMLIHDPSATVEQVILSSLGDYNPHQLQVPSSASSSPYATYDEDEEDGDSIPSNVVMEDVLNGSLNDQIPPFSSDRPHLHSHSQSNAPPQQQQQHIDHSFSSAHNVTDWKNQVNVEFLREQIGQRAARVQRRVHEQSTTPIMPNLLNLLNLRNENATDMDMEDLIVVETVLDTDGDTLHDRRRRQVGDKANENGNNPHARRNFRLDGETAEAHFYRILDEVLTEKRNKSVDTALSARGMIPQEPQHWYPRAAAAAAAGGKDTIKARLARIQPTQRGRVISTKATSAAAARAEIGVGASPQQQAQQLQQLPHLKDLVQENRRKAAKLTNVWNEHQGLILLGMTVVSIFLVAWIGFGLYGMYHFFFPAKSVLLGATATTFASTASMAAASPTAATPLGTAATSAAASEFVIRIIREVVPVREDGSILERWDDPIVDTAASAAAAAVPDKQELEKMAECIAATL
jgi:hypothetical protein